MVGITVTTLLCLINDKVLVVYLGRDFLDKGSIRQETCLQRFNCTFAIFTRQLFVRRTNRLTSSSDLMGSSAD